MNGATPSGPIACVSMSANASTTACPSTGQTAEPRHDQLRHARREVLRSDPDGDREQDAARDQRRGLTPAGEEAGDHLPGQLERVGAEEDPGQADEVEGRDARQPRPQRSARLAGT